MAYASAQWKDYGQLKRDGWRHFSTWAYFDSLAKKLGLPTRIKLLCTDLFPPTNDSIRVLRPKDASDTSPIESLVGLIDSPVVRSVDQHNLSYFDENYDSLKIPLNVAIAFAELAPLLLHQYFTYGVCFWECDVERDRVFPIRSLGVAEGELVVKQETREVIFCEVRNPHSGFGDRGRPEAYVSTHGLQKMKPKDNSHVLVLEWPTMIRATHLLWNELLFIKRELMQPGAHWHGKKKVESRINEEEGDLELRVSEMVPNSLMYELSLDARRIEMHEDMHFLTSLRQTTQPILLQATMPPTAPKDQPHVRTALRSHAIAAKKMAGQESSGGLPPLPIELEQGYSSAQAQAILSDEAGAGPHSQPMRSFMQSLQTLPTEAYTQTGKMLGPLVNSVFMPDRHDDVSEVERRLREEIRRKLDGVLGSYSVEGGAASVLKASAEYQYQRDRRCVENISRILGQILTVVWRTFVDVWNKKQQHGKRRAGTKLMSCVDLVQVIPRIDPPPDVIRSLLEINKENHETMSRLVSDLYNITLPDDRGQLESTRSNDQGVEPKKKKPAASLEEEKS